jgi:adenylate cyclase
MKKRSSLVPLFRLISGLILMFYAFGHLMNHALGLVSIEAMEVGRAWFMGFWRSAPLYWVVPAALLGHILFSFWNLFLRRTLKGMGWVAITQIVLGILCCLLLLLHISATRGVLLIHGADEPYPILLVQNLNDPLTMMIFSTLLVGFVWGHSCLGMHRWLSLKPSYKKYWAFWFSAAVLPPLLSLLGVNAGFREAELRQLDPVWMSAVMDMQEVSPEEVERIVGEIGGAMILTFFAFLALGFCIRAVANAVRRRKENISIRYPSGEVHKISEGTTVLEASRLAGISHAAVCGGNGRCSTCRTRIIAGAETLPPPSGDEEKVLKRIAAPPNVRLACQICPSRDVAVQPILAEAVPAQGFGRPSYSDGEELEVSILFADLRGFTKMSDKRLPYDVVFILNQYFELMGEAIESKDGYLDKFIGDGIMAIFGIKSGPAIGARQAIGAAMEMSRRLEVLNERLREEVDEPLRIGIGINSGKAIIGAMGYGETFSVTAIGSTVNTAARLEGVSKTYSSELVVSQQVVDTALVDLPGIPVHDVEVRGQEEPVRIYAVEVARDLKPEKRMPASAAK